jgi:hypothetical protein
MSCRIRVAVIMLRTLICSDYPLTVLEPNYLPLKSYKYIPYLKTTKKKYDLVEILCPHTRNKYRFSNLNFQLLIPFFSRFHYFLRQTWTKQKLGVGRKDAFNTLKPSGNYMYQVFQQSVAPNFELFVLFFSL